MSDPDIPDQPLKFGNKAITDMSLGELVEASFKLAKMHDDMMERRKHPKFKERMLNQPEPGINPGFTKIQDAINSEIQKRK